MKSSIIDVPRKHTQADLFGIQVYQNDSLLFDTEYIMDAENIWSRKATMTEYLDDGTMIIFNYDENEEIISQTHYDANGNVI